MSGPFYVSYVFLWLLVLLQTVVLIIIVRQLGLIHLRLGPQGAGALPEGPEVNAPAPEFRGIDVLGRGTASPWLDGRRSLLVFMSLGCSECVSLVPSLRALRRSEGKDPEIIVFSNEQGERNVDYAQKSRCPVVIAKEIFDDYSVESTPYAIAVDQHGIVRAKGVVNHVEHLESLLAYLDQADRPTYGAQQHESEVRR
jgi:methylamine dehydrogenase accessory protein MauD